MQASDETQITGQLRPEDPANGATNLDDTKEIQMKRPTSTERRDYDKSVTTKPVGTSPKKARSNGQNDGDDGNDGESAKLRTKATTVEPPSVTQKLLDLAAEAKYFHTPDQDGYATMRVGNHEETWLIRGSGFRDWLINRYLDRYNRAPGRPLDEVIDTLEARARFHNRELPVYVRVAEDHGVLYIDLGDKDWRAVEISSIGWRVVEHPPVKFRRDGHMRPLPEPVAGGTLDELRELLNVDDDGWVLLVAWLVFACQSAGPYPVLNITGEQGTSKSTTAKVLRALIDPTKAPLTSEPRSEHDLMIAATNHWTLVFDNLSYLQPWMSDALCRLATGSGYQTRKLYSNAEEMVFEATRPIILTGIRDLAVKNDLIDRSLFVVLSPIPDSLRVSEKEFWKQFKDAAPRILGALYDAVSTALRNIEDIHLLESPRMADFARWVVAAEPELPWEQGAFLSAYAENRQAAIGVSLEGDVVAVAVQDFVAERMSEPWTGTATELLVALDRLVSEGIQRSKSWPKNPNVLSGRLRTSATALRTVEIDVSFDRDGNSRTITIQKVVEGPSSSSLPSSVQAHTMHPQHDDTSTDEHAVSSHSSFSRQDGEVAQANMSDGGHRDTLATGRTLPADLVPLLAQDLSETFDRVVDAADGDVWELWELADRNEALIDAAMIVAVNDHDRGFVDALELEYVLHLLRTRQPGELLAEADNVRELHDVELMEKYPMYEVWVTARQFRDVEAYLIDKYGVPLVAHHS